MAFSAVQSRFAETRFAKKLTLTLTLKIIRPNVFRPTGFLPNRLHPTLNPNFGELGFCELGFGESGRHLFSSTAVVSPDRCYRDIGTKRIGVMTYV